MQSDLLPSPPQADPVYGKGRTAAYGTRVRIVPHLTPTKRDKPTKALRLGRLSFRSDLLVIHSTGSPSCLTLYSDRSVVMLNSALFGAVETTKGVG